MTKQLPVRRRGEVVYALVDDDVYEWARHYKWSTHGRDGEYVSRRVGETSRVALHRQILDFPESDVDHINRNTLDNRRENLRVASKSVNGHNKVTAQRNSSHGYRNVSVVRRAGRSVRYRAVVMLSGVFHHGPARTTPQEAANDVLQLRERLGVSVPAA